MLKINASVGNKGKNFASDVRCVQSLLNSKIHLLVPLMKLKVDGRCGPITIGLISEFQRRVLKMTKPDGRVDPQKTTFKHLASDTPVNPPSDKTFNHLLLATQILQRSVQARQSLQRTKLGDLDYEKAAILLGVEVAAIKAIAEVESRGSGF